MTLEETLEKKKKEDMETQGARDLEVKKYQGRTKSLIEDIQKWLSPLREQGLLNLDEVESQVEERVSRPYSQYRVYGLVISTDMGAVTISPIGWNIIGAEGRVDMRGPDRTITIVYRKDKWQFVLDKRLGEFEDVSTDSFKRIMQGLLGDAS